MTSKQINRPFESLFAAEKLLDPPSGDFRRDFETFVHWCVSNVSIGKDNRIAMNMTPEPYRFSPTSSNEDNAAAYLEHAMNVVEQALPSWQWLYEHLADEESRNMLLTVLAYRTIGWKYTPMPLDTPEFWGKLAELSELERSAQHKDIIDTKMNGITLSKFDLDPYGFPVKIFSDAFGVFNEFLYSQYVYRGSDGDVGCRRDDVALDCGACFGGTSLFLADRVGHKGKVFSFEFFPGNLKVFERNISLNSELRTRIQLIKNPVWSDKGSEVAIEGSGPATQIFHKKKKYKIMGLLQWLVSGRRQQSEDLSFQTVSIDSLLSSGKIERVDFIKMDIEGAEMSALRGARATIDRFKPTLAICVYHKLIDFYEIPQFLDRLDLGYKFFLQHSTVHGDETVLFATAKF